MYNYQQPRKLLYKQYSKRSLFEIRFFCIIVWYLIIVFACFQFSGQRNNVRDMLSLDITYKEQMHLFLLNSGLVESKVITSSLQASHSLSSVIDTLNDSDKKKKKKRKRKSNHNYDYSIIIAGMVHNSEQTLQYLLPKLDSFASQFLYAHAFVLESNSNEDKTRDLIREWSLSHTHPHPHSHNHHSKNKQYEKTVYQPTTEFPEVLELIQRRKIDTKLKHYYRRNSVNKKSAPAHSHSTANINDNQDDITVQTQIREERYVIYRNFLLKKMFEWYSDTNINESIAIDFLIWIDMDLVGFDWNNILIEFADAWRLGYSVVCANGVKYGGWYYDTYATVFNRQLWAYALNQNIEITNVIRKKRYFDDIQSCFGGFASYHFRTLLDSHCTYTNYIHHGRNNDLLQLFADKYHIQRGQQICEHLSMNFCLVEYGANLTIATKAHAFYGIRDEHG